jgi:hypothetical protein
MRDLQLLPSKVVASAEGGVAICFASQEKYADVECLNSGAILAVKSRRGGLPEVWEVPQSDNEFRVSIAQIQDFIISREATAENATTWAPRR